METILGTPKKEGKSLEFSKDLGRQNEANLARASLCLLSAKYRIIGMEGEVWDPVYQSVE